MAHVGGAGYLRQRLCNAPPSAVMGEADASMASAGWHHDRVWTALWPDPPGGGQSWASRALSRVFPENRAANDDYHDLGGDLPTCGGLGDVVGFYAWARSSARAQLWGGFLVWRWTMDVERSMLIYLVS